MFAKFCFFSQNYINFSENHLIFSENSLYLSIDEMKFRGGRSKMKLKVWFKVPGFKKYSCVFNDVEEFVDYLIELQKEYKEILIHPWKTGKKYKTTTVEVL